MNNRFVLVVWALALALAARAAAQTPNTGTLVVTVVDQTGAVVKDAKVSVLNAATGAVRDVMSGADGTVTIPALALTGQYKVSVSKAGFNAEQAPGLVLRAGETATVKVKLVAAGGKSEVTVFGTWQGVRADPQIGRSIDSERIDETPILGRKVTSVPLFNAAFRQAKGTGDLFVNATYFTTGAGSRRTTTFTLDGANNDEAWGRQTAIATVPLGAVQEMTVLSNAFSSEFGWTAGPAINIVTKSGTNSVRGEGLYLTRPGGSMQAKTFSTKGFCPPSVATCTTPSTLAAINPVDIPDQLGQVSFSLGAPIVKSKTFLFVSADYTRQDRTTFLSSTLPAFVLPADGNLEWTGHYRQGLFNGRVDHKINNNQNLMVRVNVDTFYDDNPQDAVGGTNAPSVARKYSRSSWTAQVNHTDVISPTLLNEARIAYLHGDPVTLWEAHDLSTAYTRAGNVPFTYGQSRSSDLYGHQTQFSDTLSWSKGMHYVRFGGSVIHHVSGGTGSEPGTAILGTFTFRNNTTLPFDPTCEVSCPGVLGLVDVQSYTQPIDFGIDSYKLTQWLYTGFVQDSIRLRSDLTVDLGLRYDRQSITDATTNFAPRLGFGWHPNGDPRLSVRGGYGMYYTQIRTNAVAGYLVNGLDGLTTYTATSGQLGFPTCLTGSCLPLEFDVKTLAPSQLPARDITIQAGQRDFYRQQFAAYGLNFDLLPNYPDKLVNPRSQVTSIGAEREVIQGLFIGADYVHQHWTNLDRSVDLNAPSTFDRTFAGQCRLSTPASPICNLSNSLVNTANVTAANATRPILPVNGGVRQVNVLMNLGIADYDGLQTQINYRGNSKIYLNISYTLSKATNTFEPDGNGIGANQPSMDQLGEVERGPSVVDQRHRAVISFSYQFPWNISAGTVSMFASARPFNATTGVDNNGDGSNNDRPVVNGVVLGKSAFRGTGTQDVSAFVEYRLRMHAQTVLFRLEGFNLVNHGNYLGRGQTIYGDADTASSSFGQLVSAGSATNALPAFANIDPPRMFQFQIRYIF